MRSLGLAGASIGFNRSVIGFFALRETMHSASVRLLGAYVCKCCSRDDAPWRQVDRFRADFVFAEFLCCTCFGAHGIDIPYSPFYLPYVLQAIPLLCQMFIALICSSSLPEDSVRILKLPEVWFNLWPCGPLPFGTWTAALCQWLPETDGSRCFGWYSQDSSVWRHRAMHSSPFSHNIDASGQDCFVSPSAKREGPPWGNSRDWDVPYHSLSPWCCLQVRMQTDPNLGRMGFVPALKNVATNLWWHGVQKTAEFLLI